MYKDEILRWPRNGLLGLTEQAFEREIERLKCEVSSIKSKLTPMPNELEALTQIMQSVDRARDLAWSLTTLCRARESRSTIDPQTRLARYALRECIKDLYAVVKQVRDCLAQLSPQQCQSDQWQAWFADLDEPFSPQTAVGDMVEALSAMHTHLVATLRIRPLNKTGQEVSKSYSQAVSILKTSDDAVLRRSTLASFNVWFAEHAVIFCDIQNILLNWRVLQIRRSSGDIYQTALRKEGVSVQALQAMFAAIDTRLERIRQGVTQRAQALGLRQLHASMLLADGQDESGGNTGELRGASEVIGALKSAMQPCGGDFDLFLDEALRKHWIEVAPYPAGQSGTWCENLPAHQAVAILANNPNSLTGALQFAHPCGIGHLHWSLRKLSHNLKRVPLAVIETAGIFCEAMLMNHMCAALNDRDEVERMNWQIMRRISNYLLAIPARHRLAYNMVHMRQNSVLTVKAINEMSLEAWRHYFGDTTEGFDQYVWAWKPHFYRIDTMFYDWQYTFGFLVARLLVQTFEQRGSTLAGADLQGFYHDAAAMTCDELLAKHLAVDIKDERTWLKAIDMMLEPLFGNP